MTRCKSERRAHLAPPHFKYLRKDLQETLSAGAQLRCSAFRARLLHDASLPNSFNLYCE
jgi:hypothetical protein